MENSFEIKIEEIGWATVEVGCLTSLGVLPEYRRRGLGRKLLIEVMNKAKENKLRYIHFVNMNDDFWRQMKKEFPNIKNTGPDWFIYL